MAGLGTVLGKAASKYASRKRQLDDEQYRLDLADLQREQNKADEQARFDRGVNESNRVHTRNQSEAKATREAKAMRDLEDERRNLFKNINIGALGNSTTAMEAESNLERKFNIDVPTRDFTKEFNDKLRMQNAKTAAKASSEELKAATTGFKESNDQVQTISKLISDRQKWIALGKQPDERGLFTIALSEEDKKEFRKQIIELSLEKNIATKKASSFKSVIDKKAGIGSNKKKVIGGFGGR